MSHHHHTHLADLANGDPFRVQLAAELAEIRAKQQEQAVDIKELRGLLEAWRSAKGAIRVLGWIGAVSKWIAGAGIGLGLLWAAIKTIIHLMTVADSRP